MRPVSERTLDQAMAHHRAGNLQQAAQLYREILQADPRQFNAWHLLGLIEHQNGRNDQAEAYIREALRHMPNFAEAHNSLGIALHNQGKINEAVASFELALVLKPDLAQARSNLSGLLTTTGDQLRVQGRWNDALALLEKAQRVDPGNALVYSNLGHLLQFLGRFEEAEWYLREAVRLGPTAGPAHNMLGGYLQGRGRWTEAEACYREAIRLQPDLAEAHKNLANVLYHQRHFDEAAASYQEAIRLKPTFAEAHADLGLLRLMQGQFEEGWPEYEWRWQSDMLSRHRRTFAQPTWDGEPLPNGTILLYAEQGFGDAMQFVRFAALVKERVGTVWCDCPAELSRLIATCPGVDRVITTGTPLPDFDIQSALLSLPRILKTTLGTIPATIPYLFADADLVEAWRRRLVEAGKIAPSPPGTPGGEGRGEGGQGTSTKRHDSARVHPLTPTPLPRSTGGEGRNFASLPRERGEVFCVGIVWQGNPRQWDPQLRGADRIRSIPLAQFEPLARLPGVKLFSLQKGFGTEQIAAVKDRFEVIDLGSQLHDFMDSAAVMMNLDLVITVDSSPAHLAGALGVPVWVALPTASCWRWLMERTDTPWYPTMRLFRQRELGNWSDVIENMAESLREL